MATTTASVEIPALRATTMCKAFQVTAAERADVYRFKMCCKPVASGNTTCVSQLADTR
jgi:hypothetical protein